jgi:hypothetical protein
MKRSLKELKNYSIQALDGEKGKVKNFLFDEEAWVIRYLEADLGNFFSKKRVLIPRMYLGEPQWEKKHFPVKLTVENIEQAPGLEFDLPVSRKYEEELLKHYELQPYWPANIATYAGQESMLGSGYPFTTPRKPVDEESISTSLRSFEEVRGYFIHAIDDQFGHIEDLIIDDDNWQILYVIVDTKNLVPFSKKVMLPVELIEKISYLNKEAKINLPKEDIKDAPEYNPAMAVNAEYEQVLYDFYGRKIIK